MRQLNLACMLAIAGASTSSAATLTFSLEQVGGNVTLSVNGSIVGLANWFVTSYGSGNPTFIQSGSLGMGPFESPGEINVQIMGANVKDYTWFGGIVAPSTFGTGTSYWETATSVNGNGALDPSAGDTVGFSPGGVFSDPFMGDMTYNPRITLPFGYVAGDAINTNAVFTGQTFNSLGLTPDSNYSWTYGVDTVQIIIGSAVPEPSTYGMILGGLALAGAAIRRRKAAK